MTHNKQSGGCTCGELHMQWQHPFQAHLNREDASRKHVGIPLTPRNLAAAWPYSSCQPHDAAALDDLERSISSIQPSRSMFLLPVWKSPGFAPQLWLLCPIIMSKKRRSTMCIFHRTVQRGPSQLGGCGCSKVHGKSSTCQGGMVTPTTRPCHHPLGPSGDFLLGRLLPGALGCIWERKAGSRGHRWCEAQCQSSHAMEATAGKAFPGDILYEADQTTTCTREVVSFIPWAWASPLHQGFWSGTARTQDASAREFPGTPRDTAEPSQVKSGRVKSKRG